MLYIPPAMDKDETIINKIKEVLFTGPVLRPVFRPVFIKERHSQSQKAGKPLRGFPACIGQVRVNGRPIGPAGI
jgi:hypothetical protein